MAKYLKKILACIALVLIVSAFSFTLYFVGNHSEAASQSISYSADTGEVFSANNDTLLKDALPAADKHPTLAQLNSIGYTFTGNVYKIILICAGLPAQGTSLDSCFIYVNKSINSIGMLSTSKQGLDGEVVATVKLLQNIKTTNRSVFITNISNEIVYANMDPEFNGISVLYNEYKVTRGFNGVMFQSPQSVDDLYINDMGQIYFPYYDKDGMLRKNFYLNSEGFTEEITNLPSAKADQTLTPPAKTTIIYGETYSAAVTGNKTAVTYSIKNGTAAATINASTGALTVTKAGGTVTITATAVSNDSYKPATKSWTLTINKAAQTLTRTSATSVTYGQSYTAAVSGAKTGVTYSVIGSTDIATINASTGALTIKKPGTITIKANAASTDLYNGAETSWTLTINKITQTLTPTSGNIITYGQSYTAAVSGAGTAVTYTIQNGTAAATINASTGALTSVTKAGGTVTITATAAGTDYYLPATKSWTLTINKAAQTLTRTSGATDMTFGQSYNAAVSGARTPVAFTVTNGTGQATINESTGALAVAKIGKITITANAPVGDLYLAAASISWDLNIVAAQISSAAISDIANQTYAGGVAIEPSPTLTFSGKTLVKDIDYSLTYSANIVVGTATVRITGKGNFNGSIDKTFTIIKANQAPLNVAFADNVNAWILRENGNTLGLTVTGGSGTGGLSYFSSNVNIATVDASGIVTFKAVGNFTVTVKKAGDGNYNEITASIVNIAVTDGIVKLNDVYYDSVEKAVAAATGSGNVITFVKNATITSDISISGKGITFTGEKGVKIEVSKTGSLNIAADGSLTVENLTIDGGAVWGAGINGLNANLNSESNRGAKQFIVNEGTLNITSAVISNFDCSDAQGVIKNSGTVNVTDTTVASNSANSGGAIYAAAGIVNVTGGSVENNQAKAEGGAITVANGAELVLKNTDVNGNRVSSVNGYGEAVYICESATVKLDNSNIAGTVFLKAAADASSIAKVVIVGAEMENQIILDIDSNATSSGNYAPDKYTLVVSEGNAMTSAELKDNVRIKNSGFTAKIMDEPEAYKLMLMETTEIAAIIGTFGGTFTPYTTIQKAVAAIAAIGDKTGTIYIVDSYNQNGGIWKNGKVISLSYTVLIPAGCSITFMSATRFVASDDTTVSLKAMEAGEVITLKRSVNEMSAMFEVENGATLNISNLKLDGGAVWLNNSVAQSITSVSTAAGDVTRSNSGIYAYAPIIKNYGSLTLDNGAQLVNNENKFNIFGSQYYGGGVSNLDGAQFVMKKGSSIENCYAREGGGVQNVNRGQADGNQVQINGTIKGCVSHTKGAAVETIYGCALSIIGVDAVLTGNVSLANLGVLTVEEGGILNLTGGQVDAVGDNYVIYIYNQYGDIKPDKFGNKAYVEGIACASITVSGDVVINGVIFFDDDCTVTEVSPSVQYDPYINILENYAGSDLQVQINDTNSLDSLVAKGKIDKAIVTVIVSITTKLSVRFAYDYSVDEKRVGGYDMSVTQYGLEKFIVTGVSKGLDITAGIKVNDQTLPIAADGTISGELTLKSVTYPAPGNTTTSDLGGVIVIDKENFFEIDVKYTPVSDTEKAAPNNVKFGAFSMDESYNVYAPAGTTYVAESDGEESVKLLKNNLLPDDVKIDESGYMTFYIQGDKKTAVYINKRDITAPGGGKLVGATSSSLTISTAAGVEFILADAEGNPVAWKDSDGNQLSNWIAGTDNGTYTFYGLDAEASYTVLRRSMGDPNGSPAIAPGVIQGLLPVITTLPTATDDEQNELLTRFKEAYERVEDKLNKTDFTTLILAEGKNALDEVFELYAELHDTLKLIVADEYSNIASAQKALDLKAEYDKYTVESVKNNYLTEDFDKITAAYLAGVADLFTDATDDAREITFDDAVEKMRAVPTKGTRYEIFKDELEEYKNTGTGSGGDSDDVIDIIDEGIGKIGTLTSEEEILTLIEETKLYAEKQRAKDKINKKYGEIEEKDDFDKLTQTQKDVILKLKDDIFDEIDNVVIGEDESIEDAIADLAEKIAEGEKAIVREYAKQQILKDVTTGDSEEVSDIIAEELLKIDAAEDETSILELIAPAQLAAEKQRALDAINNKYEEIIGSDGYKTSYTNDEKEAISAAKKAAEDKINAVIVTDEFYTKLDGAVEEGIFNLTYKDAVADLNAYKKPASDSEETAKVITDGIESLINGVENESIGTVQEIRDSVNETKSAADLQRAKDTAIKEVNDAYNLLANKDDLSSELADVIAAINAAETVTDVASEKTEGILDLIKANAIKELDKFVKDVSASEVTSIIDNAKTEIGVSLSAQEISNIVSDAKADALAEYRLLAKKEVQDVFDALNNKDAIEDELEDVFEDIDEENSFLKIDEAKNEGILDLQKENAKEELDKFVNGIHESEVDDIISDAKDQIDDAITNSQIDGFVRDAKSDALEKYKAIKLTDLTNLYNVLKDSGKYNSDGLAELKNIFNQGDGNAYGNISAQTTFDNIDNALTIGKNKLLEVKAASTGTGEIKPGSSENEQGGYDYPSNKKDDNLAGTVDSSAGLDSSIELRIKKNDTEIKNAIKNAVKNGLVSVALENQLTVERAKELLAEKEFKTAFDISLVYKDMQGNISVVPDEELTGVYTVRILLPRNMREIKNLQVVYINDDGTVEVFETEHVGNYLIFKTTHFSNYTILGEPETNLLWLIILLTFLIGIEIVFIVLWHLVFKKRLSGKNDDGNKDEDGQNPSGDGKKGTVKTYSFIPFALLGTVILPNGAVAACAVLGVAALLLGVYIAYLIFKTMRAKTNRNENELLVAASVDLTPFKPNKPLIAEAVRQLLGEEVEVGERKNLTATDLPLADTYYNLNGISDRGIKEKVCFAYVYQMKDESVKIIAKLGENYVASIVKKHPSIYPSRFPKGKDWYAFVVDDTFESMQNVLEIITESNSYVKRGDR